MIVEKLRYFSFGGSLQNLIIVIFAKKWKEFSQRRDFLAQQIRSFYVVVGMRFSISICGLMLILLSSIKLTAQQVDFYCTKVDNLGDITLDWQSSGLPSTYQYEIYGSTTKTGTYTLLGTITTLSITNFTHTSANGDTKQWFYFIKAVEQPPISGAEYVSDTIGSIFFVLEKQSGEKAKLIWRRPNNPPLVSQAKEFTINRQRNGIWSQFATTGDTLFIDTIHVCSENLSYEIRLYDNTGNCESISMVRTELFSDKTSPVNAPQLDSVSVNPLTGYTELGWERGSDEDIFGYLILIFDGGIWKIVDTVYGAEKTHYIDSLYDANNKSQQYCIASIDTCRNASPMGAIHTTMVLSSSEEKCDSTVTLTWNAYSGMPGGVTNYRIWVSKNGGGFVLVDDISSDPQFYIHRGIDVDVSNKYVYFVQAYNSNNGYSSSSSKKEVIFDSIAGYGDVFLRYVSVPNNQDIEIAVFAANSSVYWDLFLFKSDDDKVTFSKIDAKSRVNNVENYSFIDNNVDVQQHTYFYTAAITDECNRVFAYSDTGNNVVLNMKSSANDEISIEWKPYYGFENRLDNYDVLRRTQTETVFQFVGNVPPTQRYYDENVWSLASNGGKFYYQVAANEDNTNIYGFQDRSYSNIVEIAKEAITYIPNIFCPNSQVPENRVFKPVNSYVDMEEYVFSIYDRWGSLIFTTNDIKMGWDGSTNGKHAATGVYIYILTYRLDAEKVFKKQGHVTLVW